MHSDKWAREYRDRKRERAILNRMRNMRKPPVQAATFVTDTSDLISASDLRANVRVKRVTNAPCVACVPPVRKTIRKRWVDSKRDLRRLCKYPASMGTASMRGVKRGNDDECWKSNRKRQYRTRAL
jgi:hypothetical protein